MALLIVESVVFVVYKNKTTSGSCAKYEGIVFLSQ